MDLPGLCRKWPQGFGQPCCTDPASSAAWKYRNILKEVMAWDNVFEATGVQCAFGACDAESGKPYKKLTIRLNTELLELNILIQHQQISHYLQAEQINI